jgi:hypothetical protein
MTKSSMSLFGKAIRSWTMSFHSVMPSGTRKRRTCGSPAEARRCTSSAGSRSQRRSYLKLSLRDSASRRRSSSSAWVQKQRYAVPLASIRSASRWWRPTFAPW